MYVYIYIYGHEIIENQEPVDLGYPSWKVKNDEQKMWRSRTPTSLSPSLHKVGCTHKKNGGLLDPCRNKGNYRAMLISVTRMHVQVPIPQKWYSVWPVHLVDGKYVRFTRKTTVICCDCSETSIVDPVAIPVWWAIIIIPHFVHLYALSWLVGEISQSFSSCILPITYRHSNTTGRCEPSFKHQMFIPNNR